MKPVKYTNSLDAQYGKNILDVIKNGSVKTDRTGTGTSSLKGLQVRINLKDGFPMITTKKVHFKSIITELLWFLRGDTSQRTLKNAGCSIWDEWADKQGRLGPVYGAMWRRRPAATIDYTRKYLVESVQSTDDGVDAFKGAGGAVYLNSSETARYLQAQRATLNKSGRTDIPLTRFKDELIDFATNNEAKINGVYRFTYSIAYAQWQELLKLLIDDEERTIHKDWLHFHKFLEDFSVLPGNELCGTRNTVVYLSEDNCSKRIDKGSVQFIPSGHKEHIAEAKRITEEDQNAKGAGYVYEPVFYIDQISSVLKDIMGHSDSRRIIVDGWEPSLLPLSGVTPDNQAIFGRQALPPCHTLFQFFVDPPKKPGQKKRLSMQLLMRSQDYMLGVPFNIASYAIMLELFAMMAGLEAYELIVTGGDVHVYSNHINTALKQIKRKHRKLPTLKITGDISDINNLKVEQFVLENYTHGPVTKYPVAV